MLGEELPFEPEERVVNPAVADAIVQAARVAGVQRCADLLCEAPVGLPLAIAPAIVELAEPERTREFLEAAIEPLNHEDASDWMARGYLAANELLGSLSSPDHCADGDPEDDGEFLASLIEDVVWDYVPDEFLFAVAVLVDDRDDEAEMERAFNLVADGVLLAICQAEDALVVEA